MSRRASYDVALDSPTFLKKDSLDRFLLTPYFLDLLEPAIRGLAGPGWLLNEPILGDAKSDGRLAAVNRDIAKLTERSVREGDRPVSIAGDCCAAIGAIAGVCRAGLRPRLVWLDAHGDFNTKETSPSGFIGGMPLAMLVGRGDQTILRQLALPPLDESGVVLCDGRDLDPAERDALVSSRVTHLSDTERLGAIDFGDDPVHLHIDPDVINPQDAPAMLYATPGGPGVPQLVYALRRFAARNRIVSVSLTTWALDRDVDGMTEASVWRVLRAALGMTGWNNLRPS